MPAGRDFASEVIGDPWDFEQPGDWNQMYSVDAYDARRSAWVGIPQLVNGVFTGKPDSTVPIIDLQFEASGRLQHGHAERHAVPDRRREVPEAFLPRAPVRDSTRPGRRPDGRDVVHADRAGHRRGGKLFISRGYNPHGNRYDNQMPVPQDGSGWQIYKVDLDTSAAC